MRWLYYFPQGAEDVEAINAAIVRSDVGVGRLCQPDAAASADRGADGGAHSATGPGTDASANASAAHLRARAACCRVL